jgi:CTP:molybdopterin cytidylyltransferase MocA
VNVAAAVLAAGRSRRLGRPKQLLPVGDETLVAHVARQVCASRCARTAVVVPGDGPQIEKTLEGLPLEVLFNDECDEGVASSIRCAVRWARLGVADALVLIACDQWMLRRQHVNGLVDMLEAGAPVVASGYADTIGIPAVFRATLFDDLLALQGDLGAKRVLLTHPDVARLDWPEGRLDIDVPSDVEPLSAPRGDAWG